MGSLRSPCTTSDRSSIDTIALNCLVFEIIAFLYFGDRQTDEQADEQTNEWPGPMHEAALAVVASGGLIRLSMLSLKFSLKKFYIYVNLYFTINMVVTTIKQQP